jgi:hypothetical protein
MLQQARWSDGSYHNKGSQFHLSSCEDTLGYTRNIVKSTPLVKIFLPLRNLRREASLSLISRLSRHQRGTQTSRKAAATSAMGNTAVMLRKTVRGVRVQ